jgi:hypothetical protein
MAGPDSDAIEREIKGLGIRDDEQRHSFELRDEGEVGDFLGIRITKKGDKGFYLTQTGLIEKVLLVSGMNDSRAATTPAFVNALGSDKDGDPFDENWDYATVVGMLLYLSGNSRPDISFAVSQCCRFTHSPRHSHGIAVKRILRYLNGTRDKGILFKPLANLQVDCYVDADFAGLWGVESDQDPISVKSRSGYLITFMNCPLLWVSKLQSQIALSTMESEYIALSQSMRDLIAVREVLKEIYSIVLNDSKTKLTYRTHSKAFTEVVGKSCIPQSTVHEDNEACLKFASMPKDVLAYKTFCYSLPFLSFQS